MLTSGRGANGLGQSNMDAKRLVIRPGEIVLAGGFAVTFPQGAVGMVRYIGEPNRVPWFDRSPNAPEVICLTAREKSA